MATLKEIAQKAGVSITTVSHVVNGTRPVSEKLKERVLKAMEELGIELRFPPRKKPSQLIAMLIDDIFNPFFIEVFASAEATARSMDYHLLLLPSIEKGFDILYLRDLEEKSVDGIIVATRLGTSYLKKAFSKQLPMVFLGGSLDVPFSTGVILPDEAGTYLATKHLLSLGHTKILCIGGSTKISLFRDRFQGYLKALKEAGIPESLHYLVELNLTFQETYAFALEFLKKGIREITAVVTHNDPAALGVLKAAQNLGIRVPEDLSIVGFDNTYLTQYTNPPLTSVDIPKKIIGKRLVELMIRLIRGNHVEPCIIEEVSLSLKGSTAPKRKEESL
ncbi:MAG: LacI family DNA-binding transcriptional regulator [Atribacterota bacterium]